MHSSRYFWRIQCVTTDFLEIILETIYLMHFGRNGGEAVSLFNDFWGNEAGLAGNEFFFTLISDELQFLWLFSVERTSWYYYSLSISNPSDSFGFFWILPDRACVLSSVAISGSARPLSPSSWGSEVLFQGRLRRACFLLNWKKIWHCSQKSHKSFPALWTSINEHS